MAKPTETLRISADLALPIDAVTETFWWLGKRGSGKTHDASVFVEELLAAKAQVVVIDPMAAWWGLRSSADGTGPGLPIAIFGGDHGDIPLEASAGSYIADLAVAEGLSVILDVKAWTHADQRRFVSAFLDRLLARNSDAMHLVLEEAPLFAPQHPPRGDQTLLGTVERVVKLGRGSGIGCSLISQRSATLNKEVSTQTEVIVAHRTPAPQDRKAVKDWFDVHAPERLADAMGRLPSLPTGTAIVSSTDFLDFFGQVAFRARRTFDSSATPKAGQARREARSFADVDLAAIKEQMASTIERAKADDPRELRKRISLLERELRDTANAAPAPEQVKVEVPVEVEIPVFDEGLVVRIEDALAPFAGLLGEIQERLAWDTKVRGDMVEFRRTLNERTAARTSARTDVAPKPPKPQARAPRREDAPTDNGGLPRGERIILTAVAQHDGGVTREQLTVLTGYKRSSRDTYLQRLGARGLVEVVGGRIVVTDDGFLALGDDFEPLPSGSALREHWLRELPEGERRILAELCAVWPDGIARDNLSDLTGYKRSSRDTYLQRLRARQLITTDGDPRASDILFD